MPLEGSCLCGRITVTIADAGLPLRPLICHCKNCQTTAGSLFSVVAVVDLANLELSGEVGHYRDSGTHSGNTTSRYFCPSCGSPVHTEGPSRPGKTVVKMGLFAKTEAGKLGEPAAEIFTVNRNPWETPFASAGQFEHLFVPPKTS